MKVVILAGGYGTRISEYTKTIPKPMIPINKVPILIHLINHYRKYNFNDFYIATGYKSNEIKNYFNKIGFNYSRNYSFRQRTAYRNNKQKGDSIINRCF